MTAETQARLERIMNVYDVPDNMSIADLPEEELTRVLDLISLITIRQTTRLLTMKYKYR